MSTQPFPVSVIVDWFSFSVPHSEYKANDNELFSGYAAMRFQVLRALEALPEKLRNRTVLVPVSPRSPFQWAHQCEETKLRISGASNLDYVHIELTGTTCQVAREVGVMDLMVQAWRNHVSRIDIAIDVECDLDPDFVARQAQNKKVKTRSQFVSDTGVTAYLGSMKSDKFTRIYRYAEPHERAHLLRFEFVFRNKLAKGCANALHEHGIVSMAKTLYTGLEIASAPLYEAIQALSGKDTKLALYPDRRKGETELWIEKQVIPALLRLEREGTILNAVEFVADLISAAKAREFSDIS